MLQAGEILHNRYRIERQLGRGGMGTVFQAHDETLDIRVAVKENLNPNPQSERQFKTEASLLARLRHPNLPRVIDHFVLNERQYLVMDYVEGEDLHAVVARQLPSAEEVLRWSDALCDALAFLHSQQPPVIHRDIKPSNIKLQPDGNVMLVDFGIAKEFDQAQATTTGARGLTPGYSPPEQYGGSRTDARTDQYALAATIYSLLTGRSPTDSIERMLHKEPLKPVRSLNPAAPKHVDEALARALSLVPGERFPDVRTFQSALRGDLKALTVRAPGQTIVVPRRARMPVALLAGAGVIGLLVIGGGVAALLGSGLITRRASQATPTGSVALAATNTSSPATPTVPPSAASTPTTEIAPTPTEVLTPTPLPEITIGGGGQIAFVSDREDGQTLQVWVMNPDGSSPRQLTFGPGDKRTPRWSPDGNRLLYVADGGEGLGLDIFLLTLDGMSVINLTNAPGDDTDPRWSPDGTRIAFTSNRINNLRQVFLADIACEPPPGVCTLGRARNFSAGYAVEYAPAWSPAGDQIAVAASINGAPGRIFLRPATGGDPRQFDRSDKIIGAEFLAWSPDGNLLAFTWVQPGFNEVYVVRTSEAGRTANPIKLTNSLGNRDPVFSPDNFWIAFTSTRDQNSEIYLMTANGADQKNLTNHPARDQQPDWQPVLPGGG
jgi:serine/threonine protein kinase